MIAQSSTCCQMCREPVERVDADAADCMVGTLAGAAFAGVGFFGRSTMVCGRCLTYIRKVMAVARWLHDGTPEEEPLIALDSKVPWVDQIDEALIMVGLPQWIRTVH